MAEKIVKWFRVSLRISGDTLDPCSIEPLLGLLPQTFGIKGKAREGKNGKIYSAYSTNVWIHSLDLDASIGFDEQINHLFHQLGDKAEALRKLCNTEGIEGELFCGFGSENGQGGDSLSPANIKRIADAGLFLTLDLYPPDN